MDLTHSRFTPLRVAVLAIFPLLLSACHLTALHGSPSFNAESFKANPPRSIAVLPTKDESGHPVLAPLVRRELFAAIAPLPYEKRQPAAVDSFLAAKAVTLGVTPDKLPPEAMADPKLADCIVYSKLTRISRLYLALYAHLRFDLELKMIDTRTHEVVYQNQFIFYDRLGSPTYVVFPVLSVFALAPVATSSIESLWHLRPGRLEETFEKGTHAIAQALPVPDLLAMTPSGAVRLNAIQVTKPFEILGPGEKVIVKAEGTAGCSATLSIGKLASALSLQETTSGSYFGSYTVKPGDSADYAIVELNMAKGGEQLHFADDKDAFSVDTTAPPRARVAQVERKFLRSGLFLKFELDPAQTAQNQEKSLEYLVYKKVAGDKFERIGIVKKPLFYDSTARRDKTEEYYVVTRDGAGNTSPQWETRQVKPDAK